MRYGSAAQAKNRQKKSEIYVFTGLWGSRFSSGISNLLISVPIAERFYRSNPPPATNLILLNHKGQRLQRWPFFLFVPCSTVQNSPKFICNSAFVCLKP